MGTFFSRKIERVSPEAKQESKLKEELPDILAAYVYKRVKQHGAEEGE